MNNPTRSCAGTNPNRLENSPAPVLVAWEIHGHMVRLTDEGVSLVSIGNMTLDQGQTLDLLEVIHSALESNATGAVPAPRPPDEDEQAADLEAAFARRAQKVLRAAFTKDADR